MPDDAAAALAAALHETTIDYPHYMSPPLRMCLGGDGHTATAAAITAAVFEPRQPKEG